MAALEDHKSLLTTVQTMQKQLLKNYYIQDLLALTQNNSWSRFKADATVEQIQAAYEKAAASENADVLSDVKQLFRSHSNNIVSAIGYTQYNYNTQSYYVELRSSATPEQIQTVYDELTAIQNIVNHEEIAQWIESLTTKLPVREEKVMINATEVVQPTVIKPETLVPAHSDLAEQELVELLPEMIVTDKLEEYNSLQSVKVPVVAETAVSLEQLASYTNVANFITEDDYGFTIGPDVDREQLQMFAEELEAALEGMEGEERLQLLLQLVTDTLAEPVAFVPFSLA